MIPRSQSLIPASPRPFHPEASKKIMAPVKPELQDQPTQAVITPLSREDEEHAQVSVSRSPAFSIRPARTQPEQEEAALQAAMQGLVLNKRHALSLEIASGAMGRKYFLVRAADQRALQHAEAHLRAYTPQAEIQTLSNDDPFVLFPGEAVSAWELHAGAAAYQPMRDMKDTDPLRGILAALTLPSPLRAVAQIALVPATPTWSQSSLRKAVEHPLEQEKQEKQQHRDAMQLSIKSGAPSMPMLVLGALVLAGLLFFNRYATLIPSWVRSASTQLLHGQHPPLSSSQSLQFYGGLATLFLLPLIVLITVNHLKKHLFPKPLYSQLMVAQKTGQMAYQTRIRLYAFSPGARYSLRHVWWRYTLLVAKAMQRRLRRVVQYGYQHGRYWMSLMRNRQETKETNTALVPALNTTIIKPAHTLRLLHRAWHIWKAEVSWRQTQRQSRLNALERLATAYRQFDTASAGYFVPKRISEHRARTLVKGYWHRRITTSRHYINADFLSRAWYLPTEPLELPGIEQKLARTLPLPSNLIAPPGTQPIGYSRQGSALPFALPADFLSQHILIGGKSGEGKSTLMIHIARTAMEQGALCLIDPHGDLAHDALRSIPESRRDDVVFIDLGDQEYAIGLNPLDVLLGQDRDLTVASLVEAFRNIWESGWGTRMEAPFRSAIMTLFEANEALVAAGKAHQQYTLLDIAQLLLDESFCHDVLASVKDVYLHRFWFQYFDPLDVRQQRERIDPILTKMLQFESKVARRIIGQSCSTINLNQFVRERKILIIRLAKSEAGLIAPILGATLLSLLMAALREQSRLNPEERVGMSIIVDEFQSIPGADYAQLLAEMRKFGGTAVLGTQSFEYLAKLSPYLRATTLSNVKHYFMFKLSADDARLMAHELSDVSEEDILNLDTHSCYVRMVHQHQQQPTFTLYLERPPLQDRTIIADIRLQNRRYGRHVADVDQELFLALARSLQATPRTKQERPERSRAQRRTHTPQSQRSSAETTEGATKGATMRTDIVDSTLRETTTSLTNDPDTLVVQTHARGLGTTEETISEGLYEETGDTTFPAASETGRPNHQQHRKGHVRFQRKGKRTQKASDLPPEELITTFDIYPEEQEERGEHGEVEAE